MNTLIHMARITLAEARAARIFATFLTVTSSLLVIGLFAFAALESSTRDIVTRDLIHAGALIIATMGHLSAATLAVLLVGDTLHTKSAYTWLCAPTSRTAWLVGRWAGIALMLFIAALLWGALLAAPLLVFAGLDIAASAFARVLIASLSWMLTAAIGCGFAAYTTRILAAFYTFAVMLAFVLAPIMRDGVFNRRFARLYPTFSATARFVEPLWLDLALFDTLTHALDGSDHLWAKLPPLFAYFALALVAVLIAGTAQLRHRDLG